jgi:methylenetetrahydrofolate dehydrogenase (NADP+)/methenyltetrahydrofolate cyclohydrolase
MAELWKGAPAAAALMEDLTGRIERLSGAGVTPTLAIVRVGERPDDRAYETGAVKRCEKAGVAVKRFPLPAGCSALELRAVLEHINAVSEIHGCLMLRPLPDPAMEEMACALLDPKKDVDCMTPAALAGVFAGKGWGYPPCTARACLELLKYYKTALTGKRAVVVGRSLVIGKPVSMLLQTENATVTMCHTRTVDLPAVCRGAEVLIAAAGRANLLGAAHVSPGQVVLDVGINVDESGKLCGDVKFDEAEPVVSAITPVPGGVGAVTTAVLVKHVVEAAERTLK